MFYKTIDKKSTLRAGKTAKGGAIKNKTIPNQAGTILKSKGMHVIFRKKSKKIFKKCKKRQNLWIFRQTCSQYENNLKKLGDCVWLLHSVNC